MNKNLYLLRTSESGVWTYPVLGLEQALAAAGVRTIINQSSNSLRLLTRAMAQAGMVRNFWKSGKNIYLAILMGPAEYRLFPICYAKEAVVYCFDCWPAKYARWEAFFRRNRIKVSFFSACRSAEYFSNSIPEMNSFMARPKLSTSKPIITAGVWEGEVHRRSRIGKAKRLIPSGNFSTFKRESPGTSV